MGHGCTNHPDGQRRSRRRAFLKPTRARRPRSLGFTLVELLVALMVMALLSLMSWRGLDAMGRAQAQTQSRADDLQALRNGLAQWGADLDAMASELPLARTLNSTPSPLEWNGLALRITRYSDSLAGPGLRVVAWTVRVEQGRKQWLRWQSPVVQSRSDLQNAWTQAGLWAAQSGPARPADSGVTNALPDRRTAVQIVPLADWQIFYFRGDAWSNPASSAEASAAVPDGVRLQLTLPDNQSLAGKLTRDWMRSTVVGAKT